MKSEVDKLHVDKLVRVLVDLSVVVKNNVVRKDVYNAKIKDIEDKIPDITNLLSTAAFNAKINKVKNKITNITNLDTTTSLIAVKNKTPAHSKYITIPEFNKLTVENFAARLAQENLASKNDITNFVKKTDFDDKVNNLNKKITLSKTKHVLVENKFKKLQTFDSSTFIGQS